MAETASLSRSLRAGQSDSPLQKQARVLVLLTGLTSMAVYAVATADPLFGIVGMGAGLAAWSLRAGPAARSVPRFVVNAIVFIGLLLAIHSALSAGIRLGQIAALLATLLVLKMFDRQRSRDYAQLLTLSLFLAVAAVLESVFFRVGVILMVFIPLAIAAAMLNQAVRGQEIADLASRSPWLGPGSSPGPPTPVLAGSRALSHFRRIFTVAMTLLLFVSVAVFVLIPRGIGEGVLGGMSEEHSNRSSGFADSVALGEAGLISESTKPVLHLEVTDDQGRSLGAASRYYYLRGNPLHRYRHGRWTGNRAEATPRETTPTTPGTWMRLGPRTGPGIHQRVTLLDASASGAFLFAVFTPTAIRSDRALHLVHDRQTGRLLFATEGRGRLAYEVESVPIPGNRNGASAFSRRARFPASPRIGELATELLGEIGIDSERDFTRDEADRAAGVFRDYLRQFTYTTELEAAPEGIDPTEWFIFEHRQGHCEYFASAMAAMCRSVGIDARVVTGYLASEWNAASGHYVVRESDAHAWAEVRVGGVQWRTFDATPQGALLAVHNKDRSWTLRFQDWLGAMEHWWLTYVVTFDQSSLSLGRKNEINSSSDAVSDLDDDLDRLRENTPTDMSRVFAYAILALGIVLAAVGFGRGVWRRLVRALTFHAHARVSSSQSQAQRLHAELLRTLAARGLAKPAWQPPMEFAQVLAAREPAAADLLRRVTGLLYETRFGGREVGPELTKALAREMRLLFR